MSAIDMGNNNHRQGNCEGECQEKKKKLQDRNQISNQFIIE